MAGIILLGDSSKSGTLISNIILKELIMNIYKITTNFLFFLYEKKEWKVKGEYVLELSYLLCTFQLHIAQKMIEKRYNDLLMQ